MYVKQNERIKEQSGNSLEKGFSLPCSVVGHPCDIARALWELNSLVSVPKSERRQSMPGSLGLRILKSLNDSLRLLTLTKNLFSPIFHP